MIELYKKRGETPLEAISRLRLDSPELQDETLSYAGRLDPMAEGILPILVGKKENQERQSFLGKNKEYEVQFLLGCSTDTGDVLGVVNEYVVNEIIEKEIKKVFEVCRNFVNITKQTYPWFSSKTVHGVPLFVYAQKKDFSIERPIRSMQIYDVSNIEIKTFNTSELIDKVVQDVSKVSGDFRQKEIALSWKNSTALLNTNSQVISLTIAVSSGTYIRALTEEILNKTGVPATVLTLIRTRVY